MGSIGRAMVGGVGFVCMFCLVAFVRTFGFEYFHGDPTAVHELLDAVVGR